MPLNIHLKYGNKTTILTCLKSDFLPKAAKAFGLRQEEIEIYEIDKIDKHTQRKIGVENLKDVMRVEIKKKEISSIERKNSQRHINNETNEASSSYVPNATEICLKLTENRTMTGMERKFLCECVKKLSSDSLKRRVENGTPALVRPEMKNRKIQANPIDHKSTHTQTDTVMVAKPKPGQSTSPNDVVLQGKRLASAEKVDSRRAAQIMSEGFDQRRNFIMIERPVVAFVKEKYPLLFSLSEVRNELDRITSVGRAEEFISNIEKYAEPILSMAKDDDPFLLTTRQKENSLSTTLQKKYAVEVGSILMLSSLIGEDRNFLKLLDTNPKVSDFPYIVAQVKFNEIFVDQCTFKVYAEKQLLCEASDFKEAILCLMASYFIFNIRYPDDSFNTLVAFEKLYLRGIDTDESEIDDSTRQTIKFLQLKAEARGR